LPLPPTGILGPGGRPAATRGATTLPWRPGVLTPGTFKPDSDGHMVTFPEWPSAHLAIVRGLGARAPERHFPNWRPWPKVAPLPSKGARAPLSQLAPLVDVAPLTSELVAVREPV